MFTSGNRIRLTLIALIAGFALLGAACGSADSETADEANAETTETTAQAETTEAETEVAEPATETETETETGTSESETAESELETTEDPSSDLETAQASAEAFSQCLRDRGVDVPEISLGADGQLEITELLAGLDLSDSALQESVLACQGSLEGGLLGSLNQFMQDQTVQNAMTSFSQCVRDGGFEVIDISVAAIVGAILNGNTTGLPDPADGENSVAPILAVAMDLDPTDPAVLSTIDDCASLIQGSLGDLAGG